MKGLNQYIVEALSSSEKEELLKRFATILDNKDISFSDKNAIENKNYNYLIKHLTRLENMSIGVGEFIEKKGLKKVHDTKNAINNIFDIYNKEQKSPIYSDNNKNEGIFDQITSEKLTGKLNGKLELLNKVFDNLNKPNIKEYLKDIFYDCQQTDRRTIGPGEYFLRCMLSDIDSQNINKSDCDIYCEKAKFEVKFINTSLYKKDSDADIFNANGFKEDADFSQENLENFLHLFNRTYSNTKNSPKWPFLINQYITMDNAQINEFKNTGVIGENYIRIMEKALGLCKKSLTSYLTDKTGVIIFKGNSDTQNLAEIEICLLQPNIEDIKTFLKENDLKIYKFNKGAITVADNKIIPK